MTYSTDEHNESSFRLLLPGAVSTHAAPSPEEQVPLQQKVHAWIEKARRPFWESGVWCASLACIIFSFSSLQVKLTGGRVPVLQLCIIRSSLSFCTSIAVGLASGIRPLFGHREHFHLLFLRGFFGTLAIATSYVALLSLPLGDAVTISQMRPPVTAVMARLLLNEPLGPLGAAGSAVSVAGVMVLAHPPFLFGGHSEWSQKRLVGTLSGVASTLFGFGTTYAIRRIGKRETALTVALWYHTTTICLMTGPLLLGIPQSAAVVAPHDCLLLLGIAAASFCAQLLMTRSYQLIAAARAAAVSFTGVMYSHVLGALVFHEHLTLSTLAGGVLIFVGVLMVTVRGHGSESGASSSSTTGGTGSTLQDKCTAPTGRSLTAVDTGVTVGIGGAVQLPAAVVIQQHDGRVPPVLPARVLATVPVVEQQQQQQQSRWPAWLQLVFNSRSRSTDSSTGSSSSKYRDYCSAPSNGGVAASDAAVCDMGAAGQQQVAALSAAMQAADSLGTATAGNSEQCYSRPLAALHIDRQQKADLISSGEAGDSEDDTLQLLVSRQSEPSWASWASFSSAGSAQDQLLQQQQQQRMEQAFVEQH